MNLGWLNCLRSEEKHMLLGHIYSNILLNLFLKKLVVPCQEKLHQHAEEVNVAKRLLLN